MRKLSLSVVIIILSISAAIVNAQNAVTDDSQDANWCYDGQPWENQCMHDDPALQDWYWNAGWHMARFTSGEITYFDIPEQYRPALTELTTLIPGVEVRVEENCRIVIILPGSPYTGSGTVINPADYGRFDFDGRDYDLDGACGLEIYGTDGRDRIYGSDGDDIIIGFDGNDNITSGDGDDIVVGGDGNDRINTGDGNDIVDAGDGNDRVTTGNGDDVVNAGDGNDRVNAGRGDDTVNAGDGDDRINAGSGDDTVNAGDGDDRVNAGNGDDVVNAGDGDDTVNAGRGDDTVDTGSGTDTANGGSGTDTCTNAETNRRCE
ncbi:MAG: calcium-binding protein [Chloroflexota bacterium]